MLMDAALPSVHGEVLDVCTGSGVAALLAAPRATSTTAVDASRSAVWAARANAALNGRRVRVLHGDLFRPVADRRFDVILCNPPYLPVPDGAPESLGSPAWDGGPDGRRVLDRICREAVEALRPGGALFLVQSVLADYERTLSMLTHVGLDAVVAARHTGPLGPLARRHAGHLRAIGAMPRQDEEIVVVCAMQTAARWRLGATHGRVAAAG
jgi:release factor glutamine methyltransferase